MADLSYEYRVVVSSASPVGVEGNERVYVMTDATGDEGEMTLEEFRDMIAAKYVPERVEIQVQYRAVSAWQVAEIDEIGRLRR